MTLTPEQKAAGWIEWSGGDCPIKDDRTVHQVMFRDGQESYSARKASEWSWTQSSDHRIIAYRIIEAHGADAEPARPTPFPQSYADLVFSDDGWSQTIIVDGKRPEWLRDNDLCSWANNRGVPVGNRPMESFYAIRVRRREPKRETVKGTLSCQGNFWRVSYDLIDGKPDLSTIKIAEDAL